MGKYSAKIFYFSLLQGKLWKNFPLSFSLSDKKCQNWDFLARGGGKSVKFCTYFISSPTHFPNPQPYIYNNKMTTLL